MKFFNTLRLISKKEDTMRNLLITAILFLSLGYSIAQVPINLPEVTISEKHPPDTVFGSWKFSVQDYEFLDDKLILLVWDNSPEKASVLLTDPSQKVISAFSIPGEAKELYRDYLGYVNVICTENIYRITVAEDALHLASLPVYDYRRLIMPCIDTLKRNIYFSDYQSDYPEFTYYAYNTHDSMVQALRTVTDQEVMAGYNMEYYFLKPAERVEAMKLADYYKVDKHRVAAAMSGLTSSYFYTPLYAPLIAMKDTAYLFDHYSNAILKYDINSNLVDSLPVSYHHPKNWREWQHKVIADKETGKAYAVYKKNSFTYLKEINLKTGQIISSFKLTYSSVERIKIRNGQVYYIYRPFESLQEKFVYKESIK